MGQSELFNFLDESIPKLENTKLYTPVEKPTPDFDIDNIANQTMTPELLATLMQKIKNKEFNEEQSNKILNILKSQLNNQSIPEPQPVPTSTPYFNNQNPSYVPNPYMMSMSIINPIANNPNIPRPIIFGKNNLNLESKMNPVKYRTKPCRNYHGPNGCMRGNNCHFIHDPNYAGVDIPNFNLNNYKTEEEPERKPEIPQTQPANPINPMNPMMGMFHRPGMPMMPRMPVFMPGSYNPYMMNMMRPSMPNQPNDENK
jgi:hypothetical protein